MQGHLALVPIKNLHPNPDNPCGEAGDVTELAASIPLAKYDAPIHLGYHLRERAPRK